MKCPAIFPTESERLKALTSYGLDDEKVIKSLDPVVRMAARMFNMPAAAINIIGDDHVFFAASTGIGSVDMRRDVSFCAHAINQADVMVVPDAKLDERFHDNPLVTGEANLRFYAGIPIFSTEGLALGALCVVDGQPHSDFSDNDRQHLRELAKMASDRLELRRIEVNAERTRPEFEKYASASSFPIIWFDGACRIIEWNDAAAALHGYQWLEKITLSFDRLIVERERRTFREIISKAAASGTLNQLSVPSQITGVRKDGTEMRLSLSLACWRESNQVRFEAVLKEAVEQKQDEEQLDLQANRDELTGLVNRARFYRSVEHTLMLPAPAAVLMIDINDFKDVNDTLGPALGDRILQAIAQRLLRHAPAGSVVARVGGDEFALLLPNVADMADAMRTAESAVGELAKSYLIEGQEIKVSASCGVALAPAHSQEALELVCNADLALAAARRAGPGRVLPFSPSFRSDAVSRRNHGLEIHRAVEAGEFMLFYQPQTSLNQGLITGAEALLRWRHPERGILPPAAFLQALERSPLASAVGAWLMNEACTQAAYWRRHGRPGFRMGVNLFAAQLHSGKLVGDIVELLARHGLSADALELEVTENIVLENNAVALDTLRQLAELGVGIAFDDFGTGYASLSMLKSYPLTRIKIDGSFVKGMLASRRDAAVIRAILDMARSFDLQTIAEGIETEAERNYLADQLCEEGQGYLFGRPMPARQFERLLNADDEVSVVSL